MSTPSIALSYRNPQIEDPAVIAGRYQSLQNMQQQAAQEAQMAPLRQQLLQTQVEEERRKADNLAKATQVYRDTDAQYAQQQAAPAPVSASAAPPNPAVTAAPGATALPPAPVSAAPVPASVLAAHDRAVAAAATAAGPAATPVAGFTPVTGYSPVASAPVSASALAANAAPAAATPAAPRVPTYEEMLRQNANAAGLGPQADAMLQQRAQTQKAAIKAQQAQQAQSNQEKLAASYKQAKGDLNETTRLAIAAGVTPDAISAFETARGNAVTAAVKAWSANDEKQNALNDKILGRLDNFQTKSPDQQAAQFNNFLGQLHSDGLMSDDQYLDWQKLHPKDNPPDADQIADYRATLQQHSQIQKDAEWKVRYDTLVSTLGKTQEQTEDLLTTNGAATLAASQNPDQYTTAKIALAAKSRAAAAKFPDAEQVFGKDAKPIPDMIDAIRQIGMTPQQQDAADARDRAAEATEESNRRYLGIYDKNANANMERAKHPTAQGEKDAALAVANKYLAAAGGDYDKAMTGLAGSEDPEDQAYQVQARKMLLHLKNADTRGTGGKSTPQFVLGPDGKMHVNFPASAGATPPKPGAAPSTSAAPKPGGLASGITIRAGDGSQHWFPNETKAAEFESLVKRARGTTSRVTTPTQ